MYACMYLYVYMYICMYYTKSAFQLTNVGHNKAHPNYLQATNEVLVAAIQMDVKVTESVQWSVQSN